MSGYDCVSDLVTRARRYRLSQEEQARLDQHVAMCASCWRDQQIGADFDAVGGVRSGDDRLIAALAARAFERLDKERNPRRKRWLVVAVATMCLFVSAGAGAAVLWYLRDPPTPAIVLRSEPPSVRMQSDAPPAAPIVSEPERSEPAPPAAAPRPSAHPRTVAKRTPIAHPTESAAETATSLFAAANGARRQGDASAAIALYEKLQRLHPSSAEAQVSRVSTGRLLLEQGAWDRAVSQLDQYLVESPAGILSQEALFAKARALRALSRRDDERETLQQLVARFPSSVYATQARHRIEELR